MRNLVDKHFVRPASARLSADKLFVRPALTGDIPGSSAADASIMVGSAPGRLESLNWLDHILVSRVPQLELFITGGFVLQDVGGCMDYEGTMVTDDHLIR